VRLQELNDQLEDAGKTLDSVTTQAIKMQDKQQHKQTKKDCCGFLYNSSLYG
jgi:hypothetical protein